jgi:hypothetical protein
MRTIVGLFSLPSEKRQTKSLPSGSKPRNFSRAPSFHLLPAARTS